MKRNWKKIIKRIIAVIVLIIFLLFSGGIYSFGQRKSDEQIIKNIQKDSLQVFINHISFEGKDIRILHMQKVLDTTLLTLVFVHGSPGSALDFKKYLIDDQLNQNYNIISYDRIGYSNLYTGEVLNSIEKEVEVLHKVINKINPNKIISIGYSYGGTIALASTKNFKKKIILAGAVKGDLEPMLWVLNFYKWKLIRPLIPKVFQAAAKEKLQHISELPEFENKWGISESKIVSIHGRKDRIVPYENSLFLKDKIDKNKFSLLTIDKGNHSLVWSDFNLIKSEILKNVDY